MIESNNPEINVDEIMQKIRAEIASRATGTITNDLSITSDLHQTTSFFDWQNIQTNLGFAEQKANIANRALQMAQFPRPLRWLAKQAGRIVFYLAKVITNQQQEYNQFVLVALRSIADGIQRLDQHIEARTTSFEREIIFQERRVNMFLEEARRRLPEKFQEEQLEYFSNEDSHQLDSLYISFEDEFRGTRQDIKEKQMVYLPYITEAEAGTEEYPVLDIGCGRGEWLELLKENGFVAKGVDINRVCVEQCQDIGLNAIEGDLVEFLKGQRNNSIGLITGFHILEHLPFKQLISLFAEILRVLKSGGIIIFETPNPENIQIGACNFYLDPTHRNPLPPATLRFFAESRGFCRVKIVALNSLAKEDQIEDDGSELVRRFNQLFYGPQDYGLIGYKI